MDKYKEFLRIARQLNSQLNIVPVLYGSLGLSRVLQKDLGSKDIDILVPQRYITTDWDKLIKTLLKIDYQLVDDREHEFIRSNYKIGIAFEEDLFSFAKIDHNRLKVVSDNSVNYKVLDISQYQKVYNKSKKDSYRSQKNNKKDFEKIKLINDYIRINKSF